jgi:hypothetical protein
VMQAVGMAALMGQMQPEIPAGAPAGPGVFPPPQ